MGNVPGIICSLGVLREIRHSELFICATLASESIIINETLLYVLYDLDN